MSCPKPVVLIGMLVTISLTGQEKPCPKILATLTMDAGNLSADVAGQRVELRQCIVKTSPTFATVQIVAWGAGETTPSVSFDTEERRLNQFAVTKDAYVFEFAGPSRSRVFGIAFEWGKPRFALRTTARAHTEMISDGNSITVKIYNEQPNDPQTFILKGSRN